MSVWNYLLRDAPFWVAAFVLITSIGVLVWGLWQFSPPLRPRANPYGFTRPPLVPGETKVIDPTPMIAALEARMSEFLARISILEKQGGTSAPGLDINPLLGRLEELAGEMNKIKLFLADVPPPVDTSEIIRRITAIEKAPAPPPAAPPVDTTPLLKRLDQLEQEITKLKLFLADLPTSGAAPGKAGEDVSALTQKVEAMQKVLESLSLDQESTKPT